MFGKGGSIKNENFFCFCRNDLQRYDRLKYSTMKLNLYKAICNPMYIFHVTDDPFQRAFDLTQELQDAAKVFPQFKSSYEELWKEMRNFTVELIGIKAQNLFQAFIIKHNPLAGCCRNAQEVEIILKKSANNIAGSITFPRLQYAIDLKQKEFVSHPYTQAVSRRITKMCRTKFAYTQALKFLYHLGSG